MASRTIKAALIANPKSGRGGVDLSHALTILRANGWEATLYQKLHGGHATELARQAVKEGYNVVVDCGGDGTLNEIVEGVVGTDVAVGTLPGGTANLWAHEVGISQQLTVAATQLAGAQRRRVDVGRVSVNGGHKHHFMLMSGIGLDGAVLQNLSKPLKNRIGPIAYAPAAVKALKSFKSVPVRVDMDGIHWHGHVSQIIVGNTRRYGSFTRITADAFMDDGLLDLCLMTARGPISLGRQMGSLVVRQRPSAVLAQTYRAATVTIQTQVLLPLQVDGGLIHLSDEDVTEKGINYSFSLVNQGVSVLVPRTYDGSLFQPSWLSDSIAATPLRPAVIAASNGHSTHNSHNAHAGAVGHESGKAKDKSRDKEKSWRLQVLKVGVNTITGVRLKNGHVARILVDSDTVLDDGKETNSLLGSLSIVTEGDEITVFGFKNGEKATLRAARVILKRSGLGLSNAAVERMEEQDAATARSGSRHSKR